MVPPCFPSVGGIREDGWRAKSPRALRAGPFNRGQTQANAHTGHEGSRPDHPCCPIECPPRLLQRCLQEAREPPPKIPPTEGQSYHTQEDGAAQSADPLPNGALSVQPGVSTGQRSCQQRQVGRQQPVRPAPDSPDLRRPVPHSGLKRGFRPPRSHGPPALPRRPLPRASYNLCGDSKRIGRGRARRRNQIAAGDQRSPPSWVRPPRCAFRRLPRTRYGTDR